MDREEQLAQLEETWLGSPPSWRRPWAAIDWYFGRWVWRKCVGPGQVPPRWVFLRCSGCSQLRTYRRRKLVSECKCGSRKSTNAIGKMTTGRALWALIRGY